MTQDIARYRARLQEEADAARYAARFERGSRARIDRREQRAVRAIFAGLPDCRTVLDVPCGAGRFLRTLAAADRRVIGVDAARAILTHAQSRAHHAGLQAAWIQADAARLPLRDDAVDAVFCNRLLHHIHQPAERAVILRELRRVARRYLIVSFFDYHRFGRLRRLLKRLKGSRPNYDKQPTRAAFCAEVAACGLRLRQIVPTGPIWVAQHYFVLEKIG
ncbi:MAG: class I SAM-dependent methyltransferase [Verrucomicrobiae bacterium]|nr:class I SAM-dependent methyltransferase [Verrucomicrobiae bacterium]MDW8309799.1 class I SAM-dependent methyltransferase [Verrucomicrobiales bacterium]